MDAEASTVSESTSVSRTRTANDTWNHARPPRSDEPERKDGGALLLYCKHCPEETSYATTVTTNFRNHLSKKHNIVAEKRTSMIRTAALDDFDQLCKRLYDNGQAEEFQTKMLEKVLDQRMINEALVSLIVVRNLPFRLVEAPEFHTFCATLNPQAADHLATSHNTVSSLVDNTWQIHKDLVRKKLQSAISSIHISLDIWTSPNRHLLLGICAHFIDQPDELRRKALLALRPVAGHTGEEQCAVLFPVLQDYGIVRQVGCLVGDNVSTNDTLCRSLSGCLEKEGIIWDAEKRRLRCMGHIINLAVQAFLFQDTIGMDELKSYDNQEELGETICNQDQQQQFRLLGPLGKLHNIVVYIRKSPQRTKSFRDIAGRMVPLDNRTRWNSWYQMLDVAVQISVANAIDGFSKDHFDALRDDYLSPDDWIRLRTIKALLHPFARATLETQGDDASLDRVLFTMDILIRWFEKSLVSIAFSILIYILLIRTIGDAFSRSRSHFSYSESVGGL
jgi:BED zinc finger